MADDSWEIENTLEFHPTDIPHGIQNYILTDLTPDQQIKLNELKKDQIREDHEYLSKHPEIRAIIVLVLRLIMKHRPKYDILKFMALYFARPSGEIWGEIYEYLQERNTQVASRHSEFFFKSPSSHPSEQPQPKPMTLSGFLAEMDTNADGEYLTISQVLHNVYEDMDEESPEDVVVVVEETPEDVVVEETPEDVVVEDPLAMCSLIVDYIVGDVMGKFSEESSSINYDIMSEERRKTVSFSFEDEDDVVLLPDGQ